MSMSVFDLLSVCCFGMTCFSLGVAYGKDHNHKKKK